MKIYLFNPDTDLALACNQTNYLPPANVARMAADLALLPAWYADAGSSILAPSAYHVDFLTEATHRFPLSIQLVTPPELNEHPQASLQPWGWNPALRQRLLQSGIDEASLPSSTALQHRRTLASREQLSHWLTFFEEDEDCCGQSFNLYTLQACREFVESRTGVVLKAPWSGSGKGLNWCKGTFTPSISGWCAHVLKEQQVVTGMPIYNKVEDFAMEFFIDHHQTVHFAGYSLFETNATGAYRGNCLLSDTDIELRLTRHLPLSALLRIRQRLQSLIADEIAPYYDGYLGIDMMICQDNATGRYRIHPCAEVNLRMNMGVVALVFRQHFLAHGSTGWLRIDYAPSPQSLQQRHEYDLHNLPALIKEGRLVSGYLPLTPITPQSRYRACVYADDPTQE